MKPAFFLSLTLLCACAVESRSGNDVSNKEEFVVTPIATLDEPWAMTFLPDGRILVTEKRGRVRILTQSGKKSNSLAGVPEVAYGGQGGLGDVVLHPEFEVNHTIYLSFAEAGPGQTRGAAVLKGSLVLDDDGGGEIRDGEIIWRQIPKVTGRGHYGHRIAFSPEGYLFISSGERQKFDPSQDMQSNLGKIVRLNDDGTVPNGNPFSDRDGVAKQIWSLGHRNPLGLAFDGNGELWNHEMGPAGGDELNLVKPGNNYGYPIVSNGDHYGGKEIPDHDTRPEFEEPKLWWTPVISPSGLIFYSGNEFPSWKDNALIAGLSSKALIRVEFDAGMAREAQRYDMGKRIREVEQGPGGEIWLLEDGRRGRLLKLTAGL